MGKQGVLRRTLERWEAEPNTRKVSPVRMAVAYAQLEDRERALDWPELKYD